MSILLQNRKEQNIKKQNKLMNRKTKEYSKFTLLIRDILASALYNLFQNQPDILTHTDLTTMTEWNFAHHYAIESAKYIFWLDHDVEVTKRNYQNHRPDIIFHKRGTNKLNFLVIEIKLHGNIEDDILRIKEDWMKGSLNYQFGVCIKINSRNSYNIVLFERNKEKDLLFFNNAKIFGLLTPPSILNPISKQILYIVEKIRKGHSKNTTSQEKQLEQLICKLYQQDIEGTKSHGR